MIGQASLKKQIEGIKEITQELETATHSLFVDGKILEEGVSLEILKSMHSNLRRLRIIANQTFDSIVEARIEMERRRLDATKAALKK